MSENRIEKICTCGCGKTFYPALTRVPAPDGTKGPRYPDYIRGHHPSCRKGLQGPAWNKGLKKGDHPSIERMGYQPGHQPHNDWSHVNKALKTDTELRAKWLASKKGTTPWNKGLTQDQYHNHKTRIAQSAWQKNREGVPLELLKQIFERDNYTCQSCRWNACDAGHFVVLHVHHVVPIKVDSSLLLEPSNLVTLCPSCHRLAHSGRLPLLIQTD